MKNRLINFMLYFFSAGSGMLCFLYPFLFPALGQSLSLGAPRAGEMPLLITVLLTVCLAVLVYEIQIQAVNTRLIALLGILVAINSGLRFIEVAIPGPGGFTPIFFLIILTGYVFGGRFGFLMGSMTMLISALVTGGVGPWLPGQMFAAGWIGMSAPVCRLFSGLLHARGTRREIVILAVYGALCGLLYGAVMNLWTWPFIAGPANMYWSAGTGVGETLKRYLAFYLVTSLAWDLAGAAGNVLLVSLLGAPTLRALRRFQQRFDFTILPSSDVHSAVQPPDDRSDDRSENRPENRSENRVEGSAGSRP